MRQGILASQTAVVGSVGSGTPGLRARRPSVWRAGAATTTVSYQGRTFPGCCSGYRDEFNTSAALDYSRRVVNDFAKAPAAKTAAERIKKLEKP